MIFEMLESRAGSSISGKKKDVCPQRCTNNIQPVQLDLSFMPMLQFSKMIVTLKNVACLELIGLRFFASVADAIHILLDWGWREGRGMGLEVLGFQTQFMV